MTFALHDALSDIGKLPNDKSDTSFNMVVSSHPIPSPPQFMEICHLQDVERKLRAGINRMTDELNKNLEHQQALLKSNTKEDAKIGMSSVASSRKRKKEAREVGEKLAEESDEKGEEQKPNQPAMEWDKALMYWDKEQKTWLYRRPKGRPKKGKTWDAKEGIWVENESGDDSGGDDSGDDSGGDDSGDDDESEYRRPRGRAPNGMVWDPKKGVWREE